MRYYKLETFNDSEFKSPYRSWSTMKNGRHNPGALNIEFDIPIGPLHIPLGGSFVKIYGIGIEDIGIDFTDKYIRLHAGMSKGLPLANQSQAGMILQGKIQQSFGNWQGTEMSINFVILPGSGTFTSPVQYVLNLKKGGQLGAAVKETIETALGEMHPNIKVQNKLSPSLVAMQDEVAYFDNIGQLSMAVMDISKKLHSSDKYSGASIVLRGDEFILSDDTPSTAADKKLVFNDFIGQPVWVSFNAIQAKVVLRSDIDLIDFVQFPDAKRSIAKLATKSNDYIKNKTTFEGKFQVIELRHVGNFRQADADSWVTALTMVMQ